MTRSVLHRVQDVARTSPPQKSGRWDFVPEPAPCDGCPYADACRKRQLACRAFAEYIRTGRWKGLATPLLPSRRPYLRLFPH